MTSLSSVLLYNNTGAHNAIYRGKNLDAAVADAQYAAIAAGKTEETYTDMKLLSNTVRDGRSWLAFGEKTEEEKRQETIAANFTDLQMALAEVYEMIIGA